MGKAISTTALMVPVQPRRRSWLRRVLHALAAFGRAERRNLLLVLVVALAVWGVVELTDEVLEGSTQGLDERIILGLRTAGDTADPIGPMWIEEMARDATALGGILVAVLAVIGAGVYMVLRGLVRESIYLVVCVLGGLGVSTLFKTLIDRDRPELVTHGSHVYSASFPSGHSMMSAVIFLTLAALLMRVEPRGTIKLFLLSLAVGTCVLVGFSRVYLGVHWPTDVLAGWAGGAAWASLCYLVGERFGLLRRRDLAAAEDPAVA